jgi:hypothetical protein
MCSILPATTDSDLDQRRGFRDGTSSLLDQRSYPSSSSGRDARSTSGDDLASTGSGAGGITTRLRAGWLARIGPWDTWTLLE